MKGGEWIIRVLVGVRSHSDVSGVLLWMVIIKKKKKKNVELSLGKCSKCQTIVQNINKA